MAAGEVLYCGVWACRAAVAWGGKLVWFCGALCLAGGFVLWRLGVAGCCIRLTLVRVSELPQTAKAGDNTPPRPNRSCTGERCMASYAPPLTITPHILNRVAGLSEQLGRFAVRKQRAQALRLRQANRIRTIQGSLAIEGNSLSLEQITAVLEGRPVI